jgi:hypothetical protein
MSITNIMKTRPSRTLAIAIAAAAAIFYAAPANAQAPPQGPAPPSPNANGIETAWYTGILGAQVKQAVAAKNQQLSGIEKLGSLSWSADTISPYTVPTLYNDHPNEFYVDIPYNLAYTYTILGQSVTISQSADIQVFCEGWQTGAGVLTVNAVLQMPFFDTDQFSVIADALHLPSLVESQVQSELQSITWGTFPIPAGQACSSLGVTRAVPDQQNSVLFDSPAPKSPVPPVVTQATTMTVRLLKVTRMANGGEYQALETPHLSLWAFYSNLQLDLPPMVEGQTYTPTTNAVVQTPVPSANGELILIAAMTYDGLGREDCMYAIFGHSANFGSGTQNLITPKSWAEIIPTSTKPIWIYANGYQLTLQISWPGLPIFPGNL